MKPRYYLVNGQVWQKIETQYGVRYQRLARMGGDRNIKPPQALEEMGAVELDFVATAD